MWHDICFACDRISTSSPSSIDNSNDITECDEYDRCDDHRGDGDEYDHQYTTMSA